MSELVVRERLQEVADQVAKGERPGIRVRELLSWFGYTRRHPAAVGWIRAALRKHSLTTVPDFDWTYLDAPIIFVPATSEQSGPPTAPIARQASIGADAFLVRERLDDLTVDPTYRIGRLSLANNPPLTVLPSDSIERATTMLLRHKYSQLPVIDESKKLHGIFSWKSLGSRQALGSACVHVRDAIDDAFQITPDTPLLQAIELIEEHECVLLRGESGKITSIITHYDISATFAELSEPFLVLREIESHLRGFISEKFTDEEVAAALNLKRPTRRSGVVHSLTFWNYIRLLDDPDRWTKLGLRVDIDIFRKEVDEVRDIRNDVMHFDPDPITAEDLKKLRGFADFLNTIRSLKVTNKKSN